MMENEELVNYLVKTGRIESSRVERAFRSVDRKDFVPSGEKRAAYIDRPLELAEGATVSAPHMVALASELLEVGEDSRVLEMGSGSGYQAAILAELAAEVVGVEIQEELAFYSREKLRDYPNVSIVHGSSPGDVEGDFDRILYSFAVESLEPVVSRLSREGILVGPEQRAGGQVLRRWKDGEWTSHGRVRYVGSME